MTDRTVPDNGAVRRGKYTTVQVICSVLCGFASGIYVMLGLNQHWLLVLAAAFAFQAAWFIRDSGRMVQY